MEDVVNERILVVPGLAGLYRKLAPLSYAFIRFCVGAILVPHGVQKLFFGGVTGGVYTIIAKKLELPAPLAWAYLVALVEFLGGLMLAFGLLTRPVAIALIIEMLVVVFAVHLPIGYFWTARGTEYPLLLLLLYIAIFFRGGGRYSLDALIGREF